MTWDVLPSGERPSTTDWAAPATPSQPVDPLVEATAAKTAAIADPQARPTGSYRGRLRLEAPAVGLPIVLEVEARARVYRDEAGEARWDLFFLDRTRVLSESGLLGLRGGAGRWLVSQGDGARVEAAVVSLEPGVLGFPGWSLERDGAAGRLRGRGFLRVPSAGANLAPLAFTFELEPSAIAACQADGASCGDRETCDSASGFCAPEPFAPGRFRTDAELVAWHGPTRAWLDGPAVPATTPLPALWCAGEALGLDGSWSYPTLPNQARVLMEGSGELVCLDHGGAPRARGPVPFGSRDDLMRFGLMHVPRARTELVDVCLRELGRVPDASSTNATSADAAYERYRGGFLDYDAECVSVGHVAALLAVASRQAQDGATDGQRATARRVFGRVLQQWLELHAFLLREGVLLRGDAQASSLTDVLASMRRVEEGFALVAEALAYRSSPAQLDAGQPDYRDGIRFSTCDDRRPCGDPALRCESVAESCSAGRCEPRRCVLRRERVRVDEGPALGVAPALLDVAAAELEAASALLARGAGHGEHARGEAQAAYGRAMRWSLLLETLSSMVRAQAVAASEAGKAPWLSAWQRSADALAEARAAAVVARAR